MEYTMCVELTCAAMLVVVLICSLSLKIKSMNNKWFFTCGIISLIIVEFSDGISLHLQTMHLCRGAAIAFCFLAFLFTYIALLFLSFYIFSFFSEKGLPVSKGYYYVSVIVTGLSIIPLFINLFTGMYYYFDENLDYHHGPIHILSQLFPLVCIFLSVVVTVSGRKEVTKKQFLTFLAYCLFPFSVILLNYFIPEITWTYVVPPFFALFIFINNYSGEVMNYMQDSVNQKNKLLISQIQPHFMFNTLNSIEYLYNDNPEMGKKMINNFTKYLRTNLDNLSSDALIPFANELDHIKTFLEIEKIRFGSRLNVEFDIQETCFDVPTLVIQPLVENAVKHGVCKKIEGGTVTIHTRSDNKNVYVTISDDGVGFDTNQVIGNGHVGLYNIKQRLHNYFPQSKLEITSVIGQGTNVSIMIPKEDYYNGNINR